MYLTVTNMADDNADRRNAIFLSEVGRDIHQLLSGLCSPDKAASKTLEKDLLTPLYNSCLMSTTSLYVSLRVLTMSGLKHMILYCDNFVKGLSRVLFFFFT